MSIVTEFSIGCSKTINLGNYQNIRIEASVTVSMDPHEDLGEASAAAQMQLKQLLEQTYAAQYQHAKSLL